MITYRTENLANYNITFLVITDLIKVLDSTPLVDSTQKETFGNLALIPIARNKVVVSFDTIMLEVHKTLIEIYITLDFIQ